MRRLTQPIRALARTLARTSPAFTLIELLVVILVIGILIAIAAPSFLGQQAKAKDSAAKQNITNVYRSAKAEYTSADSQYPANIVALIASNEPSLNVVAGNAFVAGQVQVERVSPQAINIRSQSASGKQFSLSSIESGPQVGVTRASGTPLTTTTNLVPNPSFTVSLARWGTYQNFASATESLSTTVPPPFGGSTPVAALTVTSSGNDVGGVTGPFAAVTPGTQITSSAYMRSASVSRQAYMLTAWYDASNNYLGSVSGTVVSSSTTAWQRVSSTAIAPAGATQVGVYVVFNSVVAGEVHYFDDVQAIVGPAPVSYFDGDSPGSVWNGVPYSSSSTGYGSNGW